MPVMASYAATNRRNMLKVQMGNFPAMSKAQLKCFMVAQLPVEDGCYCFKLPLCYIPEYMVGNGVKTLAN
jgi:hypothetical protein